MNNYIIVCTKRTIMFLTKNLHITQIKAVFYFLLCHDNGTLQKSVLCFQKELFCQSCDLQLFVREAIHKPRPVRSKLE